jgi:hypothetical protein
MALIFMVCHKMGLPPISTKGFACVEVSSQFPAPI